MAIPADVQEALDRLPEYNSRAYHKTDNPRGMPFPGHITEFPRALQDIVTVATWLDSVAGTVAGIESEITELAGISTQMQTLAGISTEITNLEAISAAIQSLNAIKTKISAVADNEANVTAVADALTAINAVHGALTEIGNVNSNLTAITNVNGSLANVTIVADNIGSVNSVAGARDEVVALAAVVGDIATLADIEDGTLATDAISTSSSIAAQIVTVADIATQVVNLAGIAANVSTVAGLSTEVTAVANNASNINAVAGNKTNIDAVAANESDIDTVATNVTSVNTAAQNITAIQNAPQAAQDAANYAATAKRLSLFMGFDDGTSDADPGSGVFRLNAAPGSATKAFVSTTAGQGGDATAWLDSWDDSSSTVKGTLTLVNATDRSIWAVYNVTAITSATGYRKVDISLLSQNGAFADGDEFALQFDRAGDKGQDGEGTGDMLSSTYDPQGVDGDAFSMGNMTETVSAKVMTSDERTKVGYLAVTQSVDLDAIEARVNSLDAAVVLRGTWDASSGSFPGGGSAQAGDSYIVSAAGTVDGVEFAIDDRVIAVVDNASTSSASDWHKLDYTPQVLSVAGKTGAVTLVQGDVGLGNVDNTSDLDKPISTDTQTALDGKADTSHTHAISDVTNLQATLDGKATPSDISTAIADLVDSSPGTLDTLNELAAALGDDPNFATTVTNALAGKAATDLSNVTQATTRTKVGTGTMAYRDVTWGGTPPAGAAYGDFHWEFTD